MRNTIIATIKGALGTSIDIIIDATRKVGDIIDFSNLIDLIPHGADHTKFFYAVVNFCQKNGGFRTYKIESIEECPSGPMRLVAPAMI